MRIESLKLSGLDVCRDLELDFSPGFNVVLGGNGSGKTLCLWAVRAAFLGDDTLKAPTTGVIHVWVSRDGNTVGVERDLDTGKVSITTTANGKSEVWYHGEGVGSAYEDAVDRALGWGEVNAWLQTSVVSEGKLGDVMGLMASRFGMSQGKWVLAELGEARANLLGDNNGHPGELEIINDELERKLQALSQWERTAGEIDALNGRMEELLAKQSDATRGADARDESHRNLVALQELFAQRDETKAKLAELKKQQEIVKDLVEAVDQAEQALESNYGDFLNAGVDLEDALQEWSEHTSKLHDIQRRMHVAQQALAAAPGGGMVRNAVIFGASLGVLGALAGLGAGMGANSAGMGAGLALLGVVAAWLKDRSGSQVARERRRELEELQEENRVVEEALDRCKKAMGKMGDVGHPMAIRRAVVQYWKAREEVERLRERRDEFPPLTQVADQKESQAEALAAIEAKIRELKAESPYLADFDERTRRLQGEIDMAKAQSDASAARAERMGLERAELMKQLETLCDGLPALGRLERERKELARRREEASLEAESLNVCIEVWQEALERYRRQAHDDLASAVGAHFAAFTDGGYTAVRRQGPDMEVRDAAGTWHPAESLSDGTLEQLGMALRLAETSLNTSSLVLDNVFLRWDEERCRKAREALARNAAAGGQVILFTHKTGAASWGDTVLSLDASGDSGDSIPEAA